MDTKDPIWIHFDRAFDEMNKAFQEMNTKGYDKTWRLIKDERQWLDGFITGLIGGACAGGILVLIGILIGSTLT